MRKLLPKWKKIKFGIFTSNVFYLKLHIKVTAQSNIGSLIGNWTKEEVVPKMEILLKNNPILWNFNRIKQFKITFHFF